MKSGSKQVGRNSLDARIRQVLESRLEHKRVTAVGAASDLAAAGVVNTITMAVAQGDDISGRTGDVIKVGKLRIQYTFINNSNTLGNQYTGRIIIFSDSMCVGATPAVTDVLAVADPQSGYNVTSKQANRFKVYHDAVIPIVSTTVNARFHRTIMIPVNKMVHFLGATAVAGSQGRNSLFALFIADAASAGVYRYSWSYDLEYTDA